MKKTLSMQKNGVVLCPEVENANTFVSRFMGLMFRKSMPTDHGLLLTPCNEVHTFSMRFDIDVVTLSSSNKVLLVDPCVKPNKVRKKVKGGHMVLELNAGACAQLGIETGDVLTFTENK